MSDIKERRTTETNLTPSSLWLKQDWMDNNSGGIIRYTRHYIAFSHKENLFLETIAKTKLEKMRRIVCATHSMWKSTMKQEKRSFFFFLAMRIAWKKRKVLFWHVLFMSCQKRLLFVTPLLFVSRTFNEDHRLKKNMKSLVCVHSCVSTRVINKNAWKGKPWNIIYKKTKSVESLA